MFIPSLALPPVGTSLSLDIVMESGQGPFEVNAHVIDITTPADQTEPGYTVAFVLPPERARLFKTFLTAVRNRAPWSERDSSRAKRVRIRLPVEFFDGEGVRCEFTGNVSVGGLFIECRNPPARGTPLALQLYSAGRRRRVQLLCRVVHTISTARASELGFKPGAGVQFTEPTDAVTEKLTEVLGSIDSPRQTHAMVVDDDRFFRTVLGNLLRHEGLIVWEAEDGDRAFELLLEHVLRLDLLLLDLKMPGMSGSDLVEMVRSVGGQEDLAVVVITGTSLSDEERHLIAALGADDIIAKDVPQEETLERVFRVLADKKKSRA
jgi:CheY-like chemotaxis protein